MGTTQHVTKTETKELRRLCRRAIDSRDFSSLSDLGRQAGIGETTLYPFDKGLNGVSRRTADAIWPLVEKYKIPRTERLALEGHSNGLSNGHTNGHANGHTNGHANGAARASDSRINLTKNVLERLFELRDATEDAEVRSRIDTLIGSWATQGLEIISRAAMSRPMH